MCQSVEERKIPGMDYDELEIVFISEGAQYDEISLEGI